MIDRFEILAAKLRYLVSRNRWSARLLRAPVIVGHADEPGLVMIQIDGLGHRVLTRALAEDRMPFLGHLVRDEGYRLHELYAGVPSNTPAFQGELFYGVPGAVPGFGFVDPEDGRPVAMLQQPAAQRVEARLSGKGRGLLEGGSSWSNISGIRRRRSPNTRRWAGVGLSMVSDGSPRYARTSSRSGRRIDSITWLVRKPSCATSPGFKESSAIRCAISVKSATDCTSFAKSWKNPVSSTA